MQRTSRRDAPGGTIDDKGLLSRAFVLWGTRIAVWGLTRSLELDDLPQGPRSISAASGLPSHARALWEAELVRARRSARAPSLTRGVLLPVTRSAWRFALLYAALGGLCTGLVRPLMLQFLIEEVSDGRHGKPATAGYLVVLSLAVWFDSWARNHAILYGASTHMHTCLSRACAGTGT